MKWKDSDGTEEKAEMPKEENFEEGHYSPWDERKEAVKPGFFNKVPPSIIIPAAVIVALVVALVVVLLREQGDGHTSPAVAKLQDKIQLVESRLDKLEAVDEKVTRIWEQARNFEQFKERFDRSEASSTLRMDHLTMNLEALQKQLATARKTSTTKAEVAVAEPRPVKPAAPPVKEKVVAKAEKRHDTSAQAETASATKSVEYGTHQVAQSETMYGISRKYGMSLKELQNVNNLGLDSVLQIGQKLKVRK